MRIIGGEHRGRKIKQPETDAARPTKDRIREAVFNVIAEKLPGASVLDLFAGSGAYGLEALSRGAEKAVFIENDRECTSAIADNIRTLGVGPKTQIITEEAFKAVEQLCRDKERFDLVFSDPPYRTGMAKKTLLIINQYDILNPFGVLILEHNDAEVMPDVEGNVSILKRKTYGNIAVSVYIRK